MSAIKTDGTFTTASTSGAARFSLPIEGDTTTTMFEQDYMVTFANYTPLAVGTAHVTYTTHYLLRESGLEDMGGGIAKFTRTYCKVPANRTEYETYSYNFIGFWPIPSIFGLGGNGRDRWSETVLSRIDYHYTLATPPAVIPAQQYFILGYPSQKTDYIFYASNINDSADANGALTVEGYQALIAAYTDLSIDGIVAEDSRISRWNGNIYERATRYILPK